MKEAEVRMTARLLAALTPAVAVLELGEVFAANLSRRFTSSRPYGKP